MRWALLGVGLVACGSQRPSAPPVIAASPEVAEVCLADRLDTLRVATAAACQGRGEGACADGCRKGDAAACWWQGIELQERAEPRNDEARIAYQRSCDLGLANGCTNVAASQWRSAAKTEAAYACALRVFEATCAAGEHFGCGMVGQLPIERGKGNNLEESVAFLAKTCQSMGGFSCRILALMLEQRPAEPGDAERVQELLRRACAGHDWYACGEHATAADTLRKR
jgi:hypothetical protein